ncbi:MAG TPA: TPM domain-containing protein [Verrucomicrobiae bacterium]|nr:TPM domain-containing protein [Verrucomicrobiae bacterium]
MKLSSPFQRSRTFSARFNFLFIWIFLAFLLAASASPAQSPQKIKPTGYVLDYAGVLSPAARDRLTDLCTQVDKLAQAQIAVVTVKSLDGRAIEDYSIDLATQLGVGPKASDRGVLILLAVDDRQYRIEVGYGLESILPDGKVGGIGREAVPYLRDKNYDAAALLMARRVADTIAADRGVTLPPTPDLPAAPASQPPGAHTSPGGVIFLIILFLLFGSVFIVPVLRLLFGSPRSGGRRGPWMGGGFGGPFIGGAGWGGMMGGGFGGGSGGGGFGGFGGGSFGGGGASGSW